MLSGSIQKQRKRSPFLKLCLADGWAGGLAGGQGQTSQTKIYEMLSICIQNQRKCGPFLKLDLADGYAEGPADGGARLGTRKYIVCLLSFTVLTK